MNRTVALTIGVGLVLTGVGVFAGPAFSSDDTSHAGPQPATSQSSPAQLAEVPPVPATVAHAAELTKQLAEAKVVPDGYKIAAAVVTSEAAMHAGPLEFYPIGKNSSEGYKASAVLTDAAGPATLSVFVQSATKSVECTPENQCVQATPVPSSAIAAQITQSTLHRANGTSVLLTRHTGTDGKVTSLAAQTRLANGTVVTAVERAEVEQTTSGTTHTAASTRAGVPLSDEQLADLVAQPAFRY